MILKGNKMQQATKGEERMILKGNKMQQSLSSRVGGLKVKSRITAGSLCSAFDNGGCNTRAICETACHGASPNEVSAGDCCGMN